MPLENWLAFAGASAVLLAIPGPTVLLVVAYALSHGRRAALATVAGVTLGDFTAMTLSLLGLGVLLATSASLFTVLRWAGALYLVYLGLKMWRSPTALEAAGGPEAASRRAVLGHAYLVTALNPKSIAFFVAFLPQFIAPAEPLFPQLAVMEITFLALAALNAWACAWFAGSLGGMVRRPKVRRWFNRAGGGALIGAGAAMAASRGGP